MRSFTTLSAVSCPLPIPNVDTDQLIPARFMRRPRSQGYGDFLLHDLRFDAEGRERDFPLNDPALSGCGILIAQRNFGCGSSREAAVYALVDFGVRAVIAPSFGDIFASNAVKNGLLPARVSEKDLERLLAADGVQSARAINIDLENQTIVAGNLGIGFAIDPVWKTQLLNGWDDIDMTLSQSDEIRRFCAADQEARPWMAPRTG